MIADGFRQCATWFRSLFSHVSALPAGERWHMCLFWSFWLSLATFPIGYGAREVLPVVSFLFLILYYREAWQDSVLARLRVRPLFYCLWAMIGIGVLLSEDIWASLLHAGTGINKGFILPFIAMECVRDERSLRRLVWACVLACFWQGLDGLYQALTGADLFFGYVRNDGRLTGSLGDYCVGNYIALALIPAFALWFILRRTLSSAATVLLWIAVLWPGFYLLAGASSRSGALAVAAALGLWAILRGRGDMVRRLFVALGVVAVLLLALLVLQGRADMQAVGDDGRWSLWRLGWSVFLEHPWFGAGAGRYNAAFRALGLVPEQDLITISHPHNLYLDMLYAHGLVGFGLGMTFLMGFLYWGWRHIHPRVQLETAGNSGRIYWRLTAWFWIGYAGWLVNGIFGHDFYRIWWLALAMSHLGVMIGAVTNGLETENPDPTAAQETQSEPQKTCASSLKSCDGVYGKEA
ncbi:MAG: O-antigen ligase family protein [Desulfovibrio sp.]|nr:O-antigen ligase family protein [Desulfovibrio sp.]